jgi:hypothetical protein
MRFWLLLPLFLAPFAALAQTPDEDEKRVEELVRARYGPTPQEIEALALQGLGPDGQPLIDPSTGLPVVPGDLTTPAPAPVVAAPEPTPEAAPPVDLPAVGPIVFEDLQKLVGYRVKVRTYNGVSWQGDVKAVKGNEVQINVQQRGGAALMTLKKTAIAKLERI